MKKLLVLSVAILFAFAMNAQKFGAKIGYGMSGYMVNFYVPDGSKMGMGLNAGLLGEMPLNDMISLRADLTFNQLGSDYDSRDETDTNWPARALYEFDEQTTVNYMQIGISPKFTFGPAYAFVGPYFAYAISSADKSTITPVSGDIQEWTVDIFSNPRTDFDITQPLSDDNNFGGSDDLYNKIDFGFNLGLGANFSGLFVEFNAGMGLMNFINTDSQYYSSTDYATKDDATVAITGDASQKNLFFGLSLGYMFNFGE